MIYEMRTYTLKPATEAEFFKRWEPLVAERMKLSPLVGLWRSEIGPLNEVIHLWQYNSVDERTRIRAEAVASGGWPPPTSDLIVKMRSEILNPVPFKTPLPPGEYGNVYELRVYTYQNGSFPQVFERWAEKLPGREKFSPLAGCWTSELGELNRFFHLWPFKDLAERDRIRREAVAAGAWPPATREWLVAMENRILVPAPFSPMR